MDVGSLLLLCRARLTAAVGVPSGRAVLAAAGAILVLAAAALPLLGRHGFLAWSKPPSARFAALLALRALLFPSLAEEAFWRATMLPNAHTDLSEGLTSDWGMLPRLSAQQWLWVLACLLLFVAMHLASGPLLSRVGATHDQGRTFHDARFLYLATMLGIACSIVYLGSGNLWAATLVHWLPVCVWLLFLGGERRLRGVSDTSEESTSDESSAEGSLRKQLLRKRKTVFCQPRDGTETYRL
ncbi:unnamed protein product [Symbiodinium natans]|uniref:CAAX prenyl protease 2/Lysostaphin resistance protein A-like domain-containing protein n=1 Tax=Symbiodinium natans TaxID=878477 RepID=A0A812NIZ4_9DINO|nr:unnamed protein product [Symbiodinium natans]